MGKLCNCFGIHITTPCTGFLSASGTFFSATSTPYFFCKFTLEAKVFVETNTSEAFTLDTKLIEGSYPNYRLVVPTSFKQEIKLPVSVFKSKIETAALFLSESTSYVVLNFEENKLSVAASSAEIGEGCDTMEIEYSGEPFAVSFNPVFLADPLRNVDAENILFRVNDPLNPVAMETGDGFLYVIMPIRKK